MKDPMLDTEFLDKLMQDKNKIVYAKIIALNNQEQPIEAIEGVVQSGSINIDGTSAVRRTCNLTLTTKLLNINDIYWGFATRIKVNIGLQNNIDTRYNKIIWFKQGVFVITEFRTSQQVNNYTITVTGKDKMCLLNGDIGGQFNAETDLGSEDRVDGDKTTNYKIPIKTIIREMIHHYAKEPWGNIIINNIDDYGLEMVDNKKNYTQYIWVPIDNSKSLYLTGNSFIDTNISEATYSFNDNILDSNNCTFTYLITQGFKYYNAVEEDGMSQNDFSILQVNTPTNNEVSYYIIKIEPGEQIGYRTTDLTYDKDLVAAVGDTITSILDKLVKMLGSFEYFYNLDGQFVFQAKATYLNSTWQSNNELDTAPELSYIQPAMLANYSSYNFNNANLITAIQKNPHMLNIRNDFTVWGKKKNSAGSEIPIHARYAIDKKPLFYCSPLQAAGDSGYDNFYITQEGLDLLLTMAAGNINPSEYRIHTPPNAFGSTDEEKNNWWNIIDWANLYKAYTGHLPTDYIKNYQSKDTNGGFSGILHFYNGLEIGPNTYNLGPTNFSVVDIKRIDDHPDECLPAGFQKVENGRLYLSHSAFMHRFNGCWHHYTDFIRWSEQYGYESYFYQPQLDFSNEKEGTLNPLLDLWNKKKNSPVDWRELIYQMAIDYEKANHADEFEMAVMNANRPYSLALNVTDYLTGITGYEQYYHDMEGFWRLLYNPEKKYQSNMPDEEQDNTAEINGTIVTYDADGWNVLINNDPASLLFWFDFYDVTTGEMGKFSVPAIGPRPKAVNDDDVRVIMYKDVPDVIFITDDDYGKAVTTGSLNTGYHYITLDPAAFNDLSLTTRRKSAKEVIDNLLYNYTHTNDNLSLTTIPIYYLQPNSIVYIYNELSHLDGYYEVTKITLPLTYNGTMNISAIKIPQQIY